MLLGQLQISIFAVSISFWQVDLFDLYKCYIQNFPHTVRIINKLQHSSQLFRKVLSKSRREGGAIGSSQDLIGVLIQPIRRLPAYFKFLKVGKDNYDMTTLDVDW